MKLIRSAFVIARRDFTATVLSRAFLFFLLGPLFPVLLGGIFGGIGAKVAVDVPKPTIAVVMPQAQFDALADARNRLARGLGKDANIVRLVHVEPEPGIAADPVQILKAENSPAQAVLTGWLVQPQLTGEVAGDDAVVKQLRLILADSLKPQMPAPALRITTVAMPAGADSHDRAITGQVAQMLLFFLTILLSGMLLSQLIEEKSNKIIEVIAAAVPVEAMFIGKLFAMLGASLVGIAVWGTAGALAIGSLASGGLAAIPVPAVGWPAFAAFAIVYFVMNYLLLGAVFLSIGAQASTVREVQTLSMPVTFAQVVIFGFAAVAIGNPDAPAAITAAIFPLSSPLVMIARAAVIPDIWPHLMAIAWQALWVAAILWFGARLFRRTVMKSGPRRKWWWKRKAA